MASEIRRPFFIFAEEHGGNNVRDISICGVCACRSHGVECVQNAFAAEGIC